MRSRHIPTVVRGLLLAMVTSCSRHAADGGLDTTFSATRIAHASYDGRASAPRLMIDNLTLRPAHAR